MEKFSIYDLLGLFLPGFVFVYLVNLLAIVYQVPVHINEVEGTWKIEIGTFFCLALVAGAMLYSVNFWLIHKDWFNKPTQMYRKVALLYLQIDNKPRTMDKILNEKAVLWMGEPIFFTDIEWGEKNAIEKERIIDLHEEFYDRAYYELEYLGKIDVAKTFQSFYYFFRQLSTALLMITAIMIPASIISFSSWIICNKQQLFWHQAGLFVGLVAALVLSVGHARWYRKTMVLKLYWAYFTHLIQQSTNKQNNGDIN